MKPIQRIILALFVIAFFGKNTQAQKNHNPDKAAIQQVLQSQLACWNNGDIDGFMQGYWNSPELRFVSKNGVKTGWLTVLNNYKKNYDTKEKMGTLFFDIISTGITSNNNALVVGKWKVVANKTSEGFFTLWFKKIDGKWLIVLDHTS